MRVWRQQFRGAAASLWKAQQGQKSETLGPITKVESPSKQRLVKRAEGVFSDSSPPMLRVSPEVLRLMPCVVTQTAVSVFRLGSGLRSRCGDVDKVRECP